MFPFSIFNFSLLSPDLSIYYLFDYRFRLATRWLLDERLAEALYKTIEAAFKLKWGIFNKVSRGFFSAPHFINLTTIATTIFSWKQKFSISTILPKTVSHRHTSKWERIMVDPAAIKKEWREIFSTMDLDQSGSITCNELYKFIVKVMETFMIGDWLIGHWWSPWIKLIIYKRLQKWRMVERPRKWTGMR